MSFTTAGASGMFDRGPFTTGLVLDAARLALASYDREGSGPDDLAAVTDWVPITDELGLGDAVVDGFYQNGPAAGMVMQRGAGADGIVSINLRGTDLDNPIPDVLAYWSLDPTRLLTEYFADTFAMIDAAVRHALDQGIGTVLLTGHSLGGSAVSAALDHYLNGPGSQIPGIESLDFRGVTFNSPTAGLVDDPNLLHLTYGNDLIGDIVGDPSASNLLDGMWYVVDPTAISPDPALLEEDPVAYWSELSQAYTSPAHDIVRFTEALPVLTDSPIYGEITADDVVVFDRTDLPLSVEAARWLFPKLSDQIDAAERVGVIGGEAGDVITGSRGRDLIDARDGDDLVFGLDGDDELWGMAGNDRLFGDAGNDVLHGGAGDDVLRGGAGDDGFVFDRAGFGVDRVRDFAAGDVLLFTAAAGETVEIGSLGELKDWARSDDDVSARWRWWNTLEVTVADLDPETGLADGTDSTLYLDGVSGWAWA